MQFIFLFLLMFYALAEDEKFDPREDIFSQKYESGSYLIYDCLDKHWVCVNESIYKECEENRNREVASTVNVLHSCAPMGKLVTKKSCYERQLFLVSQDFGTRVCVRDVWKDKVIND